MDKKKTNKDNTVKLSFASINPFIEENRVLPTEKEISGQHFISYGNDNKYPNYLFSLYKDVASLSSIINAIVDYVAGDEVKSNVMQIDEDDVEQFIKDMTLSYILYGGVYLNVLRNRLGGIAKVVVLDYRKVRSDKKNEVFYYSDDFGVKSYGRGKYIAYPKYDPEQKSVASSILFIKRDDFSVYPTPMYNASIIACEIEKSINDYHLNNINNGFMGSVLVSLNNGVPDENVQEDIEKGFNEKFCGKENSGRVVIAYAQDKDHSAKIEKVDTEDFSARYEALSKRSREQIFTAFRMTPNLAGVTTESLGFSQEEYQQAFKLFNKTVVEPIQKKMVKNINKLFDTNAIEIKPFEIKWDDITANNKTIE